MFKTRPNSHLFKETYHFRESVQLSNSKDHQACLFTWHIVMFGNRRIKFFLLDNLRARRSMIPSINVKQMKKASGGTSRKRTLLTPQSGEARRSRASRGQREG
jgi:hypothetical protein